MQSLVRETYGAVQRRTADEREIEYALFQQITEALEASSEAGSSSEAERIDAVTRNLQMWNILAADVHLGSNPLPQSLKESIIDLSGFVRQISKQVFEGVGTGLPDLIEVNRTVMGGLLKPPGTPRIGEE